MVHIYHLHPLSWVGRGLDQPDICVAQDQIAITRRVGRSFILDLNLAGDSGPQDTSLHLAIKHSASR